MSQIMKTHRWDVVGCQGQGGTVFMLIEMTALCKIYTVEFDVIKRYWLESVRGGAKSIPVKDFANFK